MLIENVKKKNILFPLLACLVTFSLYFIEFQPGLFSNDVVWEILRFKNKLVMSSRISYFYSILLYTIFKIDVSMQLMGIIQMLLATFCICKLFRLVYSYSSKWLAYVVTSLMLLNPNIAISTLWIHRSSLFAWTFLLNIILLYKLSRTKKWNKTELFGFLLTLTLLMALRTDGLIVAIFSFLGFYKLSGMKFKSKNIVISSGILLLILLKVVPYCSSGINTGDRSYALLPFIYPIKRIQNAKNIDFQVKDKEIFYSILVKKENIEEWFGGVQDIIPDTIFESSISKTDLFKFYLWGLRFIVKNFSIFLKTQSELFLSSSFVTKTDSYYFYYREKGGTGLILPEAPEQYLYERKIKQVPFLKKAVRWLYILSSSERPSFINIFLSGTAIVFLATFIFTILALVYKNPIFYVLLPIVPYNIFLFLFQVRPNAYYWYYLVLLSYFIIFVIGCNLFKGIYLSRKPVSCDTKPSLRN